MSGWPSPTAFQAHDTTIQLNPSTGSTTTQLAGPYHSIAAPQTTSYYNGHIHRLSNVSNLMCIPEDHALPLPGSNSVRPCFYNTQTNAVHEYNNYSQSGASSRSSYGSILTNSTNTNDHLSNGHRVLGGGSPPRFSNVDIQDSRLSTKSNNASQSLFDIIAKENYQRQGSSKSQQGGITFNSPLTRSASKSRRLSSKGARDEELSLCISDYASSESVTICNQIREVNMESRGELEFLAKSFRVLRSTAVTTILLTLVLLLPVGMVILGVKYLHACPKEQLIPIYMLVGGCFWLLKMFTILWRQIRERKSSESPDALEDETQSDYITDRSTQFTDMVLSLFLLVWFGFGNYWTWRIYPPNYSMQLHEPSDWCEETLYKYCMAHIVACYSSFVLYLLSVACLCCARHICCYAYKSVHRPRGEK